MSIAPDTLTDEEASALTGAILSAFRSMTPEEIHRMLTEQNADVRPNPYAEEATDDHA